MTEETNTPQSETAAMADVLEELSALKDTDPEGYEAALSDLREGPDDGDAVGGGTSTLPSPPNSRPR